METPEGYYECAACGRRYRSATGSGKCAVCGAESRRPRPDPGTGRHAESITDRFRLAAERAKGNFLK